MRSKGIAVPRSRTDPTTGLTETESTLARLVSEGLTNRDIARTMHYSDKTVEVYLTRLYAKTGFRTRRDLTRAVERGELALETGPGRGGG